jgi:pimeloyl-ACP methyl ester carboxylesterase
MSEADNPRGSISSGTFGDSLFRFFVEDTPGAPMGLQLVSTAPVDVGRDAPPDPPAPLQADGMTPWGERVGATDALGRLVVRLKGSEDPTLIVQIHGYNNPPSAEDTMYSQCFETVGKVFAGRSDVVYVGYRWPSERALAPALWLSSFLALPALLVVMLLLGIGCLAAWRFDSGLRHFWHVALPVIGVISMAFPGVCAAFRIVTYWRDGYRAGAFGSPDLVEFLRQLDKALTLGQCKRRVKLSLVGHSYGAFVATDTVRILTDVVAPEATAPWGDLSAVNASVTNEIGERMALGNLVLVSGDIPAEALMTRRTNALEGAIRRFDDCFLVGNGGDVVLTLISTGANSFSFPSKLAKYGTRLGNVSIGERYGYGVAEIAEVEQDRDALWLLRHRLTDLDDRFKNTALSPDNPRLADCFAYLDFMDYHDQGVWRMSLGRGIGSTLPGQIVSLFFYLVTAGKLIDPHSAYFTGPVGRELIFGLCSSGRTYLKGIDRVLKAHGIKALLPKRTLLPPPS